HDHGRGSGQTEMEMALKEARYRLGEAQEKVKAVRRWTVQLPREIGEYEGPARRFGGFVEVDLKHAAGVLENRLAALEAYLSGTVPSAAPAPAPAAAPAEAPAPPPPGEGKTEVAP